MLKSRLFLLLLLLFRRRKLLSLGGNRELITKLGRDLGKNEDLRMVKLRMVRTKSERGNLGMAKTDNPATPEPAEKPKKRKEEPALATGAKLMKILKKPPKNKSKKPLPKVKITK